MTNRADAVDTMDRVDKIDFVDMVDKNLDSGFCLCQGFGKTCKPGMTFGGVSVGLEPD